MRSSAEWNGRKNNVTKECRKCHVVKPVSEFHKNNITASGLNSYCKPCACLNAKEWRKDNYEKRKRFWRKYSQEGIREQNLRRLFNLSIEQYEDMLKTQGGLCAICGNPPTKRRLHVDHDHTTQKIRGLLCHYCNAGLGHFKDDVARLDLAIEYLNRHRMEFEDATAQTAETVPAASARSAGN